MASTALKTVLLIVSTTAVFGMSKDTEEDPKYWRAILGDICQLPSFPRATGDPTRYVECVRQSDVMSDRKDLGIWLLRECLPGYDFVASSRRCKTARSIERQQALCDSVNSTSYNFCPPAEASASISIEEIREAPRQCACPNGELNCVCPNPEILAPVAVPINSEAKRRSPQRAPLSFSQYPSCPCPPSQPACFCIQISASSNEPSLASSSCCPQQPAQDPCACQQQPTVDVNCQTTTTQQQYCPTPARDQPTVSQPQPCPLVQGGVANAQYQGICSWMIDPLATDPQSRSHYLQCQPAPNNLFCGRWQRMPCAPATVFDVNAQVCVWDTNGQPATLPPATLPPATLPPVVANPPRNFDQNQCSCTGGVQIGSCNSNYQCPGQSVCQVGTQNQQPCSICCYFRKKHRLH